MSWRVPVGLIALLLAGTVLIPQDVVAGDPERPTVSRDNLRPGLRIGSGLHTGDGACLFSEGPVIETEVLVDSDTRWLSLNVDDQCDIVVTALWQGALGDGPPEIAGPLLELLRDEGTIVAEEAVASSSGEDVGTLAPMVCRYIRTSSQHVYMYGFGGSGDQLTHKNGTLKFCYDYENTWISSQSGSCSGSSPAWWRWLVDSCTTLSTVPGPTDTQVSRTGRGNYHCDPTNVFPCNASDPDGYFHRLFDKETGKPNGKSTCTFWWDGVIVAGVGREILQGCT